MLVKRFLALTKKFSNRFIILIDDYEIIINIYFNYWHTLIVIRPHRTKFCLVEPKAKDNHSKRSLHNDYKVYLQPIQRNKLLTSLNIKVHFPYVDDLFGRQ